MKKQCKGWKVGKTGKEKENKESGERSEGKKNRKWKRIIVNRGRWKEEDGRKEENVDDAKRSIY